MESRTRVKLALQHKEPDRVPIDLGGMEATGINHIAYDKLKNSLRISSETFVLFPYQGLCKVEDSVLTQIHGDVIPVAFEPKAWRRDPQIDEYEVFLPSLWMPELDDEGNEIVRDLSGEVVAKRLFGSYFFDPWGTALADIESVSDLNQKKNNKFLNCKPFYGDESWQQFGERAKHLHNNTDYFMLGNFGAKIFAGSQWLRGFDTFLIDLLVNPSLAEAIMIRLVENYMVEFDEFIESVGPYVDVIAVADDLGGQDRPLISPELYKKMIKPHHKKLYQYMHDKWDGKIMLHSDGAIGPLIPHLIEAGIDILNPVQPNLVGMDPCELKKKYGQDLSFWGGGCDTQVVLPYGTPEQVREEVHRRLDAFMPDGGYIFSQVHNILPDAPVENIIAMYAAVEEYGYY